MNFLYAISISTAYLEVLFFGGVIFGWPQLQYVLTKEGYFAEACNLSKFNQTELNNASSLQQPCTKTAEHLSSVFQLAVLVLNVSAFPLGCIQDTFGTWASRFIACFLNTGGYVLLCFSTPQNTWLLYAATVMISVGGFHFLLSNVQLGNLTSSYRSIYVTILNGMFGDSVLTFLLLQVLYDKGLKPRVFFQVLAALSLLSWARTFLLMPKKLIPFPLPNGLYKYGVFDLFKKKEPSSNLEIKEKVEDSNSLLTKKSTDSAKSENTVTVPSFRSCVFSYLFISNTFLYVASYFRFAMYLASFVSWLKSFTPTKEIGSLTEILGYVTLTVAVISPINGAIATYILRYYKPRIKSARQATLRGLAAQGLATVFIQIILNISVLTRQVYFSIVMNMFFRAFLFGTAFSFIAGAFPSQHFGKLMGLTQALGGLSSLLQYAHFKVAALYGFLAMDVYFLIISFLCFVHPFLVCREAYAKKK
uniref:Solute carrier family 43 member 3-like n=1 Tax=Phallusia mammillata TaxID=59560 RepID=A0A6F9DTE2_9ASCI|nr:solute carrier family 43 member 3-like [Phallusia mammillata]